MTVLVDMPIAKQPFPVPELLPRVPASELPEVPRQMNGTRNTPQMTPQVNGCTDDPFKLGSQYAYTPRKIKVFTIGAGFSGLLMAHKFQHRFPEMREIVDHTIFEARSDIGGTWLANHYPGVQCDVPAHIYVSVNSSANIHRLIVLQAFPFDPNPDWERFYASGSDILAYMKHTVKKWNLDRDLQLNTKVIGAQWQEGLGQWKVTVECDAKRRDEYCHVLIGAQGVLVYVNQSFSRFPV